LTGLGAVGTGCASIPSFFLPAKIILLAFIYSWAKISNRSGPI
jgi:hypothetical protein